MCCKSSGVRYWDQESPFSQENFDQTPKSSLKSSLRFFNRLKKYRLFIPFLEPMRPLSFWSLFMKYCRAFTAVSRKHISHHLQLQLQHDSTLTYCNAAITHHLHSLYSRQTRSTFPCSHWVPWCCLPQTPPRILLIQLSLSFGSYRKTTPRPSLLIISETVTLTSQDYLLLFFSPHWSNISPFSLLSCFCCSASKVVRKSEMLMCWEMFNLMVDKKKPFMMVKFTSLCPHAWLLNQCQS